MSNLEAFFVGTRLTELGKIKIGHKGAERTSAGGKKFRIPEKQDFFTLTTMNRTPAGDLVPDEALMEQLRAKHGDPDKALRQLPVRLLSNEIDDVMQVAYVWYGGKTVGARSDGRKVWWFNDRVSGQRLKEPVEEDWKPEFLTLVNSQGQALFKMHTVFNCVVAAPEAKWGGVYKFRTTSIISARQLYGSLLHLLQLTGGILVGLPLMLVVRPMQVAPGGKATTVYVVHVELRGPDLQALQIQAVEQARFRLAHQQQMHQIEGEYRKLLLPPGHEAPDEAADINEEFQPETAGEGPAPTVDPFWQSIIEGKPQEASEAEPPMAEPREAKAEETAVLPTPAAARNPVDDGSWLKCLKSIETKLGKVGSGMTPEGFLSCVAEQEIGSEDVRFQEDLDRIVTALKRGDYDWATGARLPEKGA